MFFFFLNLGEKGINNLKFTAGKVDFCLGTEEMHMPTPPDLSQEHFRVFSSVEKSKLPSSQLGLVISSYYKTIGETYCHVFMFSMLICARVETARGPDMLFLQVRQKGLDGRSAHHTHLQVVALQRRDKMLPAPPVTHFPSLAVPIARLKAIPLSLLL